MSTIKLSTFIAVPAMEPQKKTTKVYLTPVDEHLLRVMGDIIKAESIRAAELGYPVFQSEFLNYRTGELITTWKKENQ